MSDLADMAERIAEAEELERLRVEIRHLQTERQWLLDQLRGLISQRAFPVQPMLNRPIWGFDGPARNAPSGVFGGIGPFGFYRL